MASDLRDRLEDLAARTPHGVPPADLWDRGVRRRRATRAATVAAVAAVVLLVGLGGWAFRAGEQRVEPADTHGAPHLPDRFYYDPSPWTPVFDGPSGPLVTVIPAPRKTLLHTSPGLVGVTGSTGAYGFLDLPSDAALEPGMDAQFALSPDGRRLAFWLTGTPTGSPNTVQENGLTITGVGTYDTVSGKVRESRFHTAHGIMPSLLLWTDDRTLLLAYGQILGGDGSAASSSAHYADAQLWPATAARPTPVPSGAMPPFADSWSTRATSGMVVSPGSQRRTWSIFDPERLTHRVIQTDRTADLVIPSPDHRQLVAVPGRNTESGPLVVAVVPPPNAGTRAQTHFRAVPGASTWFRPLAWVDGEHVAALRKVVIEDGALGPHVAGRIDLVDLRTGHSRPLVAEYGTHGTNDSDTWLATDYLGAPVVHATAPPSPWNPRWVLGLAAFVLLCAALALWRFRGRRA